MIKNGMRPVHPGVILLEEFIKPSALPINANRLAKAIGVPTNRITAIIKGQRGITGDTAVRLAAFFDTTAEFWMNLQKTYELRLAERALPDKVRKYIQQQRDALVSFDDALLSVRLAACEDRNVLSNQAGLRFCL